MDNPFKILLPVVKSPKGAVFDIKRSDHWVSMLPLGNSGEAAKQLFQAMKEVIHVDYLAADKLVFLEAVRVPINEVCFSLQKHYLDKPIPLSRQARKIADLAIEFHHGLAIGYVQVLTKMLTKNQVPTFFNKKAVSRNVFRAVTHLNIAIMKSYQSHVPVPENAWWEMHHLYQYAAHFKLHNMEWADNVVFKKSLTTEDVYKQALFLSQADPYSLSGREIGVVHERLETWSCHGHLLGREHVAASRDKIVIDVDSDSPPYLVDDSDPGELDKIDYVFNASGLSGKIGHLVSPSRNKTTLQSREQALFQKVKKAWQGVAERKYYRQQGRGHVEVVIGLGNIYSVLKDEHELLPESQPFMPRRGPEMRSKRVSSTKKLKVSCPIIDESSNGCRLLWFEEEGIQALVGMLAAVMHNATGRGLKVWNVGVIRWIRADRSGAAEMGIEMLMPGVVAVDVVVLNQDGYESQQMQCLKIPSVPEIEQVASLAVPTFVAQPNHKLRMQYEEDGQEKEELVRLVRLREQSSYFSCFEYQEEKAHLIIEEEEVAASSRLSEKGDDIWNYI